jgi:predicted enzyme related to lactoylglutathione lyase
VKEFSMDITLYAVTLDCADAAALVRFWSELLRHPADDGATAEFASIGMSGDQGPRPRMVFVRVPEGKQVKNRVHVDLVAENLGAAVDRAVELGATRLADRADDNYRWSTLADPEGNEFDIVAA